MKEKMSKEIIRMKLCNVLEVVYAADVELNGVSSYYRNSGIETPNFIQYLRLRMDYFNLQGDVLGCDGGDIGMLSSAYFDLFGVEAFKDDLEEKISVMVDNIYTNQKNNG